MTENTTCWDSPSTFDEVFTLSGTSCPGFLQYPRAGASFLGVFLIQNGIGDRSSHPPGTVGGGILDSSWRREEEKSCCHARQPFRASKFRQDLTQCIFFDMKLRLLNSLRNVILTIHLPPRTFFNLDFTSYVVWRETHAWIPIFSEQPCLVYPWMGST